MRTRHLLAGVVLALLACRPAEAPDTSAAARQAIDAANANWARLTTAGHADSLAQYYTASGVMLPPNMPPVRGRDSIRAFFAVMNTMAPATLTLRAEQVWASGPSATELGRWTFTWPANAPRPPGVPPVDSGKYMVHWVQEDGQWLMAHDIWNSDLPPPTTKP